MKTMTNPTPAALAALTDREIDALVAERVFGLDVNERAVHGPLAGAYCVRCNGWIGDGPTCKPTPRPTSSDGNAMLEVVAEMYKIKHWFSVENELDGTWSAAFGKHCAIAKTIPRAVAEAALLALAGEVEK